MSDDPIAGPIQQGNVAGGIAAMNPLSLAGARSVANVAGQVSNVVAGMPTQAPQQPQADAMQAYMVWLDEQKAKAAAMWQHLTGQ